MSLPAWGELRKSNPISLSGITANTKGKSSSDIQRQRPGWSLFRDGVPGGERIGEVAERARSVIRRALAADGDVALFAHGHILRILTACWLELPPEAARFFALGTATLSMLGYEHENRVIQHWNN